MLDATEAVLEPLSPNVESLSEAAASSLAALRWNCVVLESAVSSKDRMPKSWAQKGGGDVLCTSSATGSGASTAAAVGGTGSDDMVGCWSRVSQGSTLASFPEYAAGSRARSEVRVAETGGTKEEKGI